MPPFALVDGRALARARASSFDRDASRRPFPRARGFIDVEVELTFTRSWSDVGLSRLVLDAAASLLSAKQSRRTRAMDALRAACARHLMTDAMRATTAGSSAGSAVHGFKLTRLAAAAPATREAREVMDARTANAIAKALNDVTADDLHRTLAIARRGGRRERKERERAGDGEIQDERGVDDDDKVRYLNIHSCEEYVIGAFVFGKRGEIPLHNHPGMTVWSRVIYGDARVTAYDFVEVAPKLSVSEAKMGRAPTHMATLVRDEVVHGGEGSETSVLYPNSGGNVHKLTAVTACAVLDVQSPPYAVGRGRDCHYFEIVRDGDDDGDDGVKKNVVMLRETLPPLDFAIESVAVH